MWPRGANTVQAHENLDLGPQALSFSSINVMPTDYDIRACSPSLQLVSIALC